MKGAYYAQLILRDQLYLIFIQSISLEKDNSEIIALLKERLVTPELRV